MDAEADSRAHCWEPTECLFSDVPLLPMYLSAFMGTTKFHSEETIINEYMYVKDCNWRDSVIMYI